MLKKSILVVTAGAVFIGMSSIGYAASFAGWDKMIMPPSTKQHVVNYRYPYVRIGAGVYDFNSSKIEIGTLNSTTAPLARIDNSKITPFYNLAVGYAFYNQNNSWVTRVFGHDNAVELQLDYFNVTQKQRKPNNFGNGLVWFIDGSGTMVPGGLGTPVRDLNFTAKRRYINGGLYYRGSWITSNPRIVFLPRTGLILTNLNEKYDYTVQYGTGVPGIFRTDRENYKVNTNYYGIAAGGRLGYKVKPRMLVFGDLEGQLLYARSKLDVYQNAFVEFVASNIFTRQINRTHSKLTYRAILAAGGQYKINDKITSPSVEAKIGLDRWGYDPKVVPPNHAGSGPVYLMGEQKLNYFANIGVTVPIG